MAQRNPPEVSVTDMMAHIRQQLARRRAGSPAVLGGGARAAGPPAEGPPLEDFRALKPHIDWHQILTGLKLAEEHVAVGADVPEMTSLPGPLRRLGRLIARCILILTRFITTRQREFNTAALGTIHNVHGMLRHLEQVQRENLQRLEALSARHNAAFNALNARMDRLERELTHGKQGLHAQDRRLGQLLEEV